MILNCLTKFNVIKTLYSKENIGSLNPGLSLLNNRFTELVASVRLLKYGSESRLNCRGVASQIFPLSPGKLLS